jgi:prepilin-type N-terminal cleavage/methylation domain-containing protein
MSRPSARPPVRRTTGFTLVEVLVSLVIAGTAALLAHGLFSAAVQGSAQLRAARHALDRGSNLRRFLTSAFLSIEVGADGAGSFVGHSDRVRFATWLQTADGWFERRDIVLSLQAGRLFATMSSEPPLVLSDSVVTLGFDYLLEPGTEARWVSEWISPVSAPLAVRIRITRRPDGATLVGDSTIYLIKARG